MNAQMFRRSQILLAAMLALAVVIAPQTVAAEPPQNIILLIGDGMGDEQLSAASLFAYGAEGKLTMQALPVQTAVATDPAQGGVTDSAAAGTALATGHKVKNGVLSLRTPGDGAELETLLERCAKSGKRTGLVTTTYMTHATPAAFGSHVSRRNKLDEVARGYLEQTRPNLLLGGGGKGMTVEAATAAGYSVVTTREQMHALDLDLVTHVSGQFGVGHMPYEWEYSVRIDDGYDTLPHLNEMTRFALEMLSRGEQGFFLMIEGGRIDHAGHANHLHNNILETLEFDNAVRTVMRWAAGREDTLVIVTADHECGGLKVLEHKGRGEWPSVNWTSTHHTGVKVPLFAWGVGAEPFAEVSDNTQIPQIILTGEVPDEVPDGGAPTGEPAAAMSQ